MGLANESGWTLWPFQSTSNRSEVPISRYTAREKWGPTRVEVLLERLNGRGFVVLHVEHRVELGDLKEIVDLLGEVQELQFAALVLGSGERADQFADAGAVDIVHVGQIQHDLLVAFG